MKLGGIIANLSVLAFVAGTAFPVAYAQTADADPEAAADEEAPGETVLAPELPLTMAKDGAITPPSGQVVTFVETIRDASGPEGSVVRFRFLAPAIARSGGSVTVDMAQVDMQALCDGYALPRLPETDPQPAQIIISLADRPVPFGEADPEATQFFESFRPENGRCLWEAF